MKTIMYYGVEISKPARTNPTNPSGDYPATYYKGLHTYTLKEGEDEARVRAAIEARCRSYPDGAFMGWIRTPHFEWIN